MERIEIDIIISEIHPKHFVKHESGNVHLKVTAFPNHKGKQSHIIFIDNVFHGFANIVHEDNNVIELPLDATIDNLPF